MEITRRNLFKGAAAAGAVLAAPPTWVQGAARAATPARIGTATDPLAIPPVVVAGSSPIHLAIRNATHQFHSSLKPCATLAYQATNATGQNTTAPTTYLGPTIVAQSGSTVSVTVTNEITSHPLAAALDLAVHGTLAGDAGQPRTAVHLHGGNTRPGSDGGPEETFPLGNMGGPGLSNPFTYTYENSQEAAGLWYHDHALGITRLNVYAGLAAGYLVRGGKDDGTGTTFPVGEFELPLIIQDKTFNRDGTQFYTPAPWVPEFFGDTPVVNGVAFPLHTVKQGQYRFRVYNGSNARFYRLNLKNKATGARLPILQVGSDGGLLNQPVQLPDLLLAPGERADLVVDFTGLPAGTLVDMENRAATPFPAGAAKARPGGNQISKVMQFRVSNAAGWDGTISPTTSLRAEPVYRLDGLTPARTRTHSLVELFNPDGTVRMATLNNRTFDDDAYKTAAAVSPDSLEVWEFANTTMDTHPIHLHLVQFQVLNRQTFNAMGYLATHYPPDPATGLLQPNTGPYPAPSPDAFLVGAPQPPAANELGWKDTVQAPPGTVTRIAVPFGSGAVAGPIAATAVHTGEYVWHCHILDHEDNDMMQKYVIA